MPYVKKEYREKMDPTINALIKELEQLQVDWGPVVTAGNINYAVTRILKHFYGYVDGHDVTTNYAKINNAIGVLSCIQQEYYRKVAAPYEEQKEFENGSVK